jgi:hypothetical protein
VPRLLFLLAVSAIVAAAAAAAGAASPPPFAYASILTASQGMGTPMPSSAVWVASRQREAVRVTDGDWVNTNQPVYVIEITGHFVDRDASSPCCHRTFPRGTVATFVLDRRTGEGLDFGLGHKRIDLRVLGRVHNLLPSLRALRLASPFCSALDSLRTLVVERIGPRPALAHERFGVAARRRVARAPAVQRLADVVCGLPRFPAGVFHCPFDTGVQYRLSFTGGGTGLVLRGFRLVADPSGCLSLAGAGPVRRALPSFWQTLGDTLGLKHPTVGAFGGTSR